MLKSQSESACDGSEVVLQLACSARLDRIVENRDTGKSGNGLFKELQPFPA